MHCVCKHPLQQVTLVSAELGCLTTAGLLHFQVPDDQDDVMDAKMEGSFFARSWPTTIAAPLISLAGLYTDKGRLAIAPHPRNAIRRVHRYANLLLAYRYAARELTINDSINLIRNR